MIKDKTKEYWVPGRPATFATNHEVPWKGKIKEHIGSEINTYNSVEIEFKITKANIEKYAFDIDNLCEPVFAVLTSQLGWFGSKRANINSWRAIKTQNEIEGMILKDVRSIGFIKPEYPAVFDAVYQGKFPNKATEVLMPEWIKSHSGFKGVNKQCAIRLLFGTKTLSIATISSGKVKPIIDCLYPILGGLCGAPDDHKITELYVEKSVEELTEDQVRITIWEI